jgi:hypothetical protein
LYLSLRNLTWWERNATSDEHVMRVSTDNGATFGPLLKLTTNGTIGSSGDSAAGGEVGEIAEKKDASSTPEG